jgi:predicted NBD/HSP70 family sugar kinase
VNVGIDLGGTFTRVAVGDQPIARLRTDPDYNRHISTLISVIPRKPTGVGVSVAGRVDPTGRSVTVALNLPGYEGRALRDDLAEALSCPVRIAHDATCGLLGEHAYGSLRGEDRCGYVTLSTGTGYAIWLGRGGHFVAMTTEAGHQLVAGNDRRCACGQVGCLETLTGGRALEQWTGGPLSGVHDPAFWRGYGAALARGLANFALVSGVEAVALGGAVAVHRKELWPALRDGLAEVLTYRPLRVVPAALGENATLAGAVALLTTPEPNVLH